MLDSILTFIFGSKHDRDIKKLTPILEQINAEEEWAASLSKEQFREHTEVFKAFYVGCPKDKVQDRMNERLPKALAMAKKHFNCENLDGIPLENGGGSGTIGSHWEGSYMYGDIMVGFNSNDAQLSDITLALFDDAGFYQVEYYSGGLFKFGKNKGCGFFENHCSYFPNEFCSYIDENE